MLSAANLIRRLYKVFRPPESAPLPDAKPIRFGILGAAAIAPNGLILPAKSHPEATVLAVAARDKTGAEAYARKYGIPKAYGGPTSYQDLLNDEEIDAIYNPLPNGLHYEWTMKALAAGKHVLLEKPSSDSAEDTKAMFDYAESKDLVLLEAFHYRCERSAIVSQTVYVTPQFHPAIQRVKAILDGGELGAIKHIDAIFTIPMGFIKSNDIRYNYELGGGALMDLGCYTINCVRYLSSSNPVSVLSANHELHLPRQDFVSKIDRSTTATFELPNDATATIICDLRSSGILPQLMTKVGCEGGLIKIYNPIIPTFYHYITIEKRGEKARTEKVYTFADAKVEGKGEDWWTTYRYQLDAFVDRLKDRTPQTWLHRDDAISNMEWIERVYEKVRAILLAMESCVIV